MHPGGPLWARRDAGVWSIPKGEFADDEDPAAAARREFAEELGSPAPKDLPVDLGEVRQRGGKRVRAWGAPGNLDASAIRSNTFALEWPPRSGRISEFPEVDRAQWFTLAQAGERIVDAQRALLERLATALGIEPES